MPYSNTPADWSRLMFDSSRLWTDAGLVVALRSWRIMAGGPAAQREIERMLSEKVEAGFELTGALAGGRVKSPEAAARKAIGQRFAVQVLHDEEVDAPLTTHVVERADVRVVQAGDGFRFAFETLAQFRIRCQVPGQYLDRDHTIQPGISGLVDLAHPAGAKR